MADENQNNFPQISSDVSEFQQEMDLKEKLSLIDKEIRQLYKFCVQEGFSPAQIEKCAEPLLNVGKAQKKKKWLKRLGTLLLVVGFFASIYFYAPAYNKVCIYAKLASMKVLPYWDWRFIYEKDCLVENPFNVQETLTEEECKSRCGDLKKIDVVEKSNHSAMTDYLMNVTPVVIKDATESWRARNEFSVEFLAKLYNETPDLKHLTVCQFQTTLLGYGDPATFLKDVVDKTIKENYQTYWENCDKGGAKVLRQFYRRPYFLPPMVESVESNFLIVSSGGSKSLKITGKSRIILRPDGICDTACKPLIFQMKPGESLMFSNELWAMSFKPLGDSPVIAIGSTGSTF